jgi:hypothetical protein
MLFHVTSEDDIRVIDEQGTGRYGSGSTFASEQELQKLARKPTYLVSHGDCCTFSNARDGWASSLSTRRSASTKSQNLEV